MISSLVEEALVRDSGMVSGHGCRLLYSFSLPQVRVVIGFTSTQTSQTL